MMLPVIVSAPPTNDEYPIILEVNEINKLDISALAELSKKKDAPLIVYSMEPAETRMIQVNESQCSLDLDTGEFTEELVSSHLEPCDLYQYHVIEAGYPSKHKTFSYAASNGNASYFITSLQEEIASIRNAQMENDNQEFIISDFSGDSRSYDWYWIDDQWYTGVISAVDDGDGWTWKQRHQFEVYRSVYDYATGYKWWTVEEAITTYVDSGDYKTDYANWVGPWIYDRSNSIWNYDATEWDHGPTTSVGSWSYSLSAQVRITGDGPSVQFGVSESYSQSQVKIIDHSTSSKVEWQELFPPESGPTIPNYVGHPFYMTPPISASHNTYKSYRGSLFYHSSTSSFDFNWWASSSVHYDAGFFWFILLFWTRYSTGILDQNTESYPATGS